MNEKTKNALLSIVASLVCIVIGLLVGFIILYCINAENAVDGFTRIIKGGFYLKPKGIGSEIAQSAPLIMTGLSVAFAFKTGLFNIGAAGQYTVGVFGALYFAIILHMPWYVCLLAAMVCGAIWGAVPGIFKAYFNVNEVITSIMFNWIGLYLVNELMYNTIPDMYDQKTTRTYKLSSASPKSLIPDCGMNSIFRTSSTTIAIFIAIAIAVIIYIVLSKTTFGYELKACGFNKDAAKYAGINEKRNVVLSMTIAGALAGIGAGSTSSPVHPSGTRRYRQHSRPSDLMVSRLRFLHLATRSALSSLLSSLLIFRSAVLTCLRNIISRRSRT